MKKMFGWVTRLKRRFHKSTFLATLDQVNEFKGLVNRQPCPSCGKNGLLLESFVRNPIGWSAEVKCDNCNFVGTVNSEGFDFGELASKGKARD